MRAALFTLLLWLASCAHLPAILSAASQGAQLLGHVLDEADIGAGKFFAKHVNFERQAAIADALLRCRKSTRELDEAIVYGDETEVKKAQEQALVDYKHLFQLLKASGVLDGICPAPCGGAESDAPEPGPLKLPKPEEIAQVL